MTGPASRLQAALAQALPTVRSAAARVWGLPGLRDRYPEYLRLMHGVIRASVPLMDLAAERCARSGRDDPVAVPLRGYLLRHRDEEIDHDGWLLDDLSALDEPAADLASAMPPPVVARLVGAQYYWVGHHDPVCLLGYIAVMEGNAPHRDLSTRLVTAAGVPEGAVRTVREHAALDVGHAEEVFDLVDTLPLTAAQTVAVTTSALHTADALVGLFKHIADTGKDGLP